MSTRTPLLFVRHGQTPWNVAGLWQGQADIGLSEEGESQAREVAAALAGLSVRPWRRILSSDLERASRTAEAIADALELPLVLDARLRERDVGFWSGRTHAELEAEDGEAFRAFWARAPDVRPGGGETTAEVRARALSLVRDVAREAPGESAIIVTHLGVIRTLIPEAESANAGRNDAFAEDLLEHRHEHERAGAGDAL